MMSQPAKLTSGQRWISKSEPELGLGLVLRAVRGKVEMFFPAANEQRMYAFASAPLQRVEFSPGDVIKSHTGVNATVSSVDERDGLLVYLCEDGQEIPEPELADTVSFSKPDSKLLAGIIDPPRVFDLRLEARRRQAEWHKNGLVGLVGARVDLLPHQFAIATEATNRLRPRLLLADEVGLGKTIEACLILHRLHLTGRANRVLILVPEPLTHQWFVELLRRFNLLFSLFDEERCQSIEQHHEGENPFLDSQLVLCSPELLVAHPKRTAQVLEADWDLLIVDEAHHLEWSESKASAEYALVDSLAAQVEGLLLLTATPEQLGADGHFARLRLLDPERYESLAAFREETAHYAEVASFIDRLRAGESPSADDRKMLEAKSARALALCTDVEGRDEMARDALIAELLDAFGTGRVMFRNSRKALGGFPGRESELIELPGGDETLLAPQADWLVTFLADHPEQKVLVIGSTKELAQEFATAIEERVNVKVGLFHEDLNLLQRDRAAAWFAEEDGASVLCCSEIGSEGRNFQFAHHLLLIDLPENPELLEQRIGRLDRIGQSETIKIHVPFMAGTKGDLLAHWYRDGMTVFGECVHGAAEIGERCKKPLLAALAAVGSATFEKKKAALIAATQLAAKEVGEKLAGGQDRLLELKSRPSAGVGLLLDGIREADEDVRLQRFILRLFEQFGVAVEDLGENSYHLTSDHITTDSLPDLPANGLTITFDRARALAREEMALGSIDHPLVRGAMELLAGSDIGSASFGVWEHPAGEGLFLETIWIVEAVAPPALHADRFLPATPVRVAVDHLAKPVSGIGLRSAQLRNGDPAKLFSIDKVKREIVPAMLKQSAKDVTELRDKIVESAREAAEQQCDSEIARLKDLCEINHSVHPREIEALKKGKSALLKAIDAAPVRLDAVRLIRRATPRVRK